MARNVRLEAYKKSQGESHIEDWPGGEESLAEPRDREREIVGEDQQIRLTCLRECLENLKTADRALALDYYSAEEEKEKVHRQRLASVLPPSFCVFFFRWRHRLRVDVHGDPGRTGKLGQNLGKESTPNRVKIGYRGV